MCVCLDYSVLVDCAFCISLYALYLYPGQLEGIRAAINSTAPVAPSKITVQASQSQCTCWQFIWICMSTLSICYSAAVYYACCFVSHTVVITIRLTHSERDINLKQNCIMAVTFLNLWEWSRLYMLLAPIFRYTQNFVIRIRPDLIPIRTYSFRIQSATFGGVIID